jgi:transposase
VKPVRLPWAEPMSRFTALFERLAIDVLKETSVTGAMRLLRLTWDEARNIMDRAVERGLLAKENRIPEVIGIDEKAIAKGHEYFPLVCDLNRKAVEYVAEDRTKESLTGSFAPLTPEQREDMEAVAMDMWDPYVHVVRQYVPDADQKIVFDRFHVMGVMEHGTLDCHCGMPFDSITNNAYWCHSPTNGP